MEKRGQSKILAVILIILMIFALIIILWNILFPLIKTNLELTEINAELVRVRMNLDNVSGDFALLDKVNITLSRGPEKLILENITEINIPIDMDIISIVDVSGSMGNEYPGECSMDYSAGSCCDVNDCSTSVGCRVCHGKLEDGECVLYSSINNNCCFSEGVDCSLKEDCEFCSETSNVFSYPTSCWGEIYGNIYRACWGSLNICNNCEGIWTNKLSLAKSSNLELIDHIFSENENHRIGLVAYSTETVEEYSIGLTGISEKELLDEKVDDWTYLSQTCICCGIQSAADYLKDSTRLKSIILMSDGVASMKCFAENVDDLNGNGDVDDSGDHAIKAAQDAYNDYGISIYTIGLGHDADEDTLRAIANAGKGKYYYSDISELEDVYKMTTTELIRNYKTENRWDHLKIIFRGTFEGKETSWAYDHYELPMPLETQIYEVPESDILNQHIDNLSRVDIYMAVYTSDGTEILSPLLGSFQIE